MMSHIQDVTAEYPTLTDEKLKGYLGIWGRLIASDFRSKMEVTLTMDYGGFAYPMLQRCTLAYGEEKRELTYEQALMVKDWLESLPRD